jgi:hypothetical protein
MAKKEVRKIGKPAVGADCIKCISSLQLLFSLPGLKFSLVHIF